MCKYTRKTFIIIFYFLTVKKNITYFILQLNYIDGFSSNLIYKNKTFKKPNQRFKKPN